MGNDSIGTEHSMISSCDATAADAMTALRSPSNCEWQQWFYIIVGELGMIQNHARHHPTCASDVVARYNDLHIITMEYFVQGTLVSFRYIWTKEGLTA